MDILIFNEPRFFITTSFSILFCYFNATIFVTSIFLATHTTRFHCFYMKQNQTSLLIIGQYRCNNIVFDFIVLSDFNSHWNSIYEDFFSHLMRPLFGMPKYFIDNIDKWVFLVRINSNKLTIKFLFYFAFCLFIS